MSGYRMRPGDGGSGQRIGAGEGDRTLVLSLENSCSTIELHPQRHYERPVRNTLLRFRSRMVGEVGLEPTKP
jgi:hypothetical protein